MKKTILFTSAIALSFLLAECSKSNNSPSNAASVMVVNGCAGTTAINATANGTTFPGGTDLALGKSSGYKNITAGTSVPFAFTLTDGTPLIAGSGSLAAGSYYSVFTGGLITGSSLIFTTDDLTAPAAGDAKVRFVNLCSDGYSVASYVGTDKIDSNRAYESVSPFYNVPAATGVALLMQNPSAPVDQAELTGQQLTAGKIYTVILTGSAAATSGSSVLTLSVINNN